MNSSLKRFAFLACLSLTLHPAQAQLSTWTGDAGDNQWSSAGNWNPDGEPTGDAFIQSTASITLPTGGTSVGAVDIFGNGNLVTLTGTTTTNFSTGAIFVYHAGDLVLNLQPGNQFNVADDGNFVGDSSFGSGTFTVNGNGTLAFSGGVDPLYVGAGNVGIMNQNGGTISINGALTVGSDSDEFGNGGAGGVGIYNLSGTSTLSVSQLLLGVGSSPTAPTATGTFTMTGGQVTAGLVTLGVNGVTETDAVNGDSGVINQSGGSFTGTTIEIGESSGGIGIYNLSGTGTFNGTTVAIGDQAGAIGTFLQSGSSTGTVTTLEVGEAGTGAYGLSSGTLTVLTGGGIVVGDQAGSVGTFTQSGGDVVTQGTSGITVGNDGTGSYIQQGGTNTVAGALDVGTGAGTGTYTLDAGTLTANSAITIGGGGGTGVFNYNGGTLNASSGIFVDNGGTFNQGADFTPSLQEIALSAGAIYNLNAGATLTIGGNMTGATSGIFASNGAFFNFNGGTVSVTGLNWVDALNGAVNGNSTIDTNGLTALLTGTLTGSGVLTVTGGGTLDITTVDSSTASWGIDAENGIVSANATTFPSTGGITIGSNGTVEMATAGTDNLSGALSGTGVFDVNFGSNTDVLELSSAASFGGGTTNLNGNGTLEVLNGSFGNITGTGSLTIGAGPGTGAVSLNGTNNTYTGSTFINQGYTLTASNLSGAGVTNDGFLGSNAPLGTTPATTLSINGPLVSTGTLLFRMDAGNPDVIAVNNTANISGGVTLLDAGGNFSGPIVTTAANGDLTYTGPGTITANALVTATLAPDANDRDLILTLTTTSISSLPGINLTPNQAAVASAIDPILLNPTNLTPGQSQNFNILINDIAPAGASASQIARNLEQLTPESLQYGNFINTEHATFLAQKVDYIDTLIRQDSTGFNASAINITAPGFDSGLGQMMQSLLAFDAPPSGGYHTNAPNGVNYYPGQDGTISTTPTTPDAVAPSQTLDSPTISDSPAPPLPLRTEPRNVELRQPYSHFSAFLGGDATLANLNQDQGASYAPSSKASYTSADAIAGVSYRMSSNLSAGVLMDYSHTDADTDSYGSRTHIDSYSPGVFATYGDKGFYINGLFAYTRNSYSNDRVIPVVGSTANSSPDGNQFTGALDAGYDFHPAYGWTITPLGGLTYTHIDVDSFSESGATPADLNVDAQHDNSLRTRLGSNLSYQVQLGQISLLPSFSAQWQHEFLDENAPITSNFSDFNSQPFTIHSVTEGRDTALISVGLTATLDTNMAVFLQCTADVGGNYDAENIVGGFKGSF